MRQLYGDDADEYHDNDDDKDGDDDDDDCDDDYDDDDGDDGDHDHQHQRSRPDSSFTWAFRVQGQYAIYGWLLILIFIILLGSRNENKWI